MITTLYFTTFVGESISIECTRVNVEDPFGRTLTFENTTEEDTMKGELISLAAVREKRKCKRCEGTGLVATEVPLKTFADSFGIEARVCSSCDGKGWCKKST